MALGWKILPQDTHISRCGVLLNTPQCPGAPTPETVTSWVHGAGSPLYLHLQLYASLTGTEKDRKVIGGRGHSGSPPLHLSAPQSRNAHRAMHKAVAAGPSALCRPGPRPVLTRRADRQCRLTRHAVEADDLVHERGGQDDLIKDRHAAPNHACVAALWVHGQVPPMTVSGSSTGGASGPSAGHCPVPAGHIPGPEPLCPFPSHRLLPWP